MKTDLSQSCGHCWVFQICWHIECSTFTASSFRIWNSSTGIPSPLLAMFIVILPKANLTSYWLHKIDINQTKRKKKHFQPHGAAGIRHLIRSQLTKNHQELDKDLSYFGHSSDLTGENAKNHLSRVISIAVKHCLRLGLTLEGREEAGIIAPMQAVRKEVCGWRERMEWNCRVKSLVLQLHIQFLKFCISLV